MANEPAETNSKFSLQTYLVVIFLTLLLVVGVALGALSYSNAVSIIEDSAEGKLARLSQLAAARANALFHPAEGVLELISASPGVGGSTLRERLSIVPQMIRGLERSEHITSVYVGNREGDFLLVRRLPTDPEAAKRYMAPPGTKYVLQSIERQDDVDRETGEFIHIGSDGAEVGRVERPDYVQYDPRVRAWYKSAIKAVGTTQTPPYVYFTTKEVGLTLSRRGRGGFSIVGVDITLGSLGASMAESKVTPNSEAVLLSQDGIVIAHPDPGRMTVSEADNNLRPAHVSDIENAMLEEAFERFKTKGEIRSHISDKDGVSYEITFAPVPIGSLDSPVVALVIPQHELMAKANELLRLGATWFAVLMFAGFGLVLLCSKWVTRPLRELRDRAEAMRRFEFEQTSPVRTGISEIEELANAVYMMRSTIRRFLDISTAVAAEADFDKLITRLLDEIVATTQTEAAIIYLTNDEETRLVPYAGRLDLGRDLIYPVPDVLLNNEESIVVRSTVDELAESALATDEELKMIGLEGISNEMDDPPKHLLAAPLYNRQRELIGVLLLFETDELDSALVRFTEALSGSAAVSIETRQLIMAQKELFESFIQLVAGAIDTKSPYTGGHCERVPEITKMLADAANKTNSGPFKDFVLTEEDKEAVHVAAWLHDCGKVTSPEYVVDKATKLETIYDRIHEVRMRVEVMKKEAEIRSLRAILDGGDSAKLEATLKEELAGLDEDFAFLADCNIGGEFMSDDKIERLRGLAGKTWTRTLDDRLGVSHEEAARKDRNDPVALPAQEPLLNDRAEHLFNRPERDALPPDNKWGFKMDVPEHLYNRGELYNLCVRRGTLTAEDRYKINEHIVQTIKMLEQLPFPRHLRQVPELAGGHHEKMDGTGYPKRLAKEDMSPVARMMALADIFEALTAVDRPYKKGKTLSEALKIMGFMVKDSHIDAEIFRLFLESGIHDRYAKKFMRPEQIDEVDTAAFLSAVK